MKDKERYKEESKDIMKKERYQEQETVLGNRRLYKNGGYIEEGLEIKRQDGVTTIVDIKKRRFYINKEGDVKNNGLILRGICMVIKKKK